MNRKAQDGFTVIDTLTGLLCLIMLGGLAMPVLVHMRSLARLENCERRLREVVIAAHNYHDANKALPPATLGFENAVDAGPWAEQPESEVYWKHAQNSSGILLVAHYMELNRYADKVHPIAFNRSSTLKEWNAQDGVPTWEWQGEIDDMSEIMTEVIDGLYCPEDDLQDHSVRAIIATQPCLPFESDDMQAIDSCRDIATQYWPNEEEQPGLTNYVACLGRTGGQSYGEDRTWRGAMSSRQRVTLEGIHDGTSRTIMYGESLGEIRDGERVAAMSWLWGGGARMTGHWPADAGEHPADPDIPMLGNDRYSSGVGFGSNHDGIVTFGLCDGSVRRISRDCDRRTLYQLAAAWDGDVPMEF